MDKIWDLYENMNEIIVVSDMDNYDIVYMNRKARCQHKIESVEDLKEIKCYQLLQNSPYPCVCCNNTNLKCDFYSEWQYVKLPVGEPFMLKDVFTEEDSRRYRMELAIDELAGEFQHEKIRNHLDIEEIINQGLRLSLSTISPNESIRVLLEYVGKSLMCERIYIFEEKRLDDETFYDNTYEWCEEGVIPQKDNLQNIPDEDVAIWLEHFNRNENVIIADIEELKTSDPDLYRYLKPQDIRSIVVSPLIYSEKIIGFFGVDNPPESFMVNISTLFMIMGHFIVALLRRRDLFERLEKLSFYDELTGVGNRHLMADYVADMEPEKSVGVVYCDVTGLKRINDTQGHAAGDALLVRACRCLKGTFSRFKLFRLGGDEFLVLCSGIGEDELAEKVEQLKQSMSDYDVLMAVGSIWSPNGAADMDGLLAEADERMYEAKRKYYEDREKV
jgi:diguanylate cyclase (GGDEF)-like protein